MRTKYTTIEMDWPAFVAVLNRETGGDWWDRIPEFTAQDEFEPCECCDWHPLSDERAAQLNRVLGLVKSLGGPSPVVVYTHCCDELFIEWHGQEGDVRVSLDMHNRFPWSALVSSKDAEAYFIRVPKAKGPVTA